MGIASALLRPNSVTLQQGAREKDQRKYTEHAESTHACMQSDDPKLVHNNPEEKLKSYAWCAVNRVSLDVDEMLHTQKTKVTEST